MSGKEWAHSGSASSSMNVTSNERLVCRDPAADAVIPTCRPATAADLHPTFSTGTTMAVLSMWWPATSPTRKECNVYRLSSIPAARGLAWRVVVVCAGFSAKSLSLRLLGALGSRNPETLCWCPYPGRCVVSVLDQCGHSLISLLYVFPSSIGAKP